MPYINKEDRKRLIITQEPLSSGELNYYITKLCVDYLDDSDKSYAAYNNIIGVLECVKLEFYARCVRPYEDSKKEVNGDVY